MTPEYVRMALPLLQALAEGKKLEFKTIGENVQWSPWIPNYTFFFERNEYRVAVDPRAEWRVKVHSTVQAYADAYAQEDSAAEMGSALQALDELLNNIPKED